MLRRDGKIIMPTWVNLAQLLLWHSISSRRHNESNLCLSWLQFSVPCSVTVHQKGSATNRTSLDAEPFDAKSRHSSTLCIQCSHNVGNHFRRTESQETMCSLIHVCLSIVHSFKKKGATDEKASWAFAAAHLWCSRLPNFDPYCAWPQLGKYDWASFITEQRYQWSKWVWDASAAAPSLPSPWKWTPDYWTGKLMYSLHQPLDGKLPLADVATARPTHTVTVSCGATFTYYSTNLYRFTTLVFVLCFYLKTNSSPLDLYGT